MHGARRYVVVQNKMPFMQETDYTNKKIITETYTILSEENMMLMLFCGFVIRLRRNESSNWTNGPENEKTSNFVPKNECRPRERTVLDTKALWYNFYIPHSLIVDLAD